MKVGPSVGPGSTWGVSGVLSGAREVKNFPNPLCGIPITTGGPIGILVSKTVLLSDHSHST